MKLILTVVALLVTFNLSAQSLTFRASKKAVYVGNKKMIEYNANYHTITLVTKDSVVYVDANTVQKFKVKVITSNKKKNANVFSYLCDKKSVVTTDIKRNILTIQKADTTYIFSTGVFLTNLKAK